MTAYDLAYQLYMMGKNNEGGTVPAYGEGLPREGYWVGGKYPSLVFDSVADLDRGEIAWWIGNHRARWYGVWADETDGKIYFDAVTHMNFLHMATGLGKIRGEISIWDIARGEEVRLSYDN